MLAHGQQLVQDTHGSLFQTRVTVSVKPLEIDTLYLKHLFRRSFRNSVRVTGNGSKLI